MCLARAYLRTTNGHADEAADPASTADGTALMMENLTHVQVDGETLTLRSLFGDTKSLHGRISSIDFSEGRLILQDLEP